MKKSFFIFLFYNLAFYSCNMQDNCRERPRNQTSPLPSPSGRYVLTVPAVREERGGYSSYWKVTISDSEGKLLYTDEEGFPARFNVYWTWDDSDRAWLYNSDDGSIYYWEYKGIWTKTKHEKKNDSLRIPYDLLPPYAE